MQSNNFNLQLHLNDNSALSPRIKRSGVKLTTYLHLTPRIRICGAMLSIPQHVFMAWYLMKYRDNFVFNFLHLNAYLCM
jgi:hypothetical protein